MNLHQKALNYKSIFEHLPGAYLILSPELNIITASKAYLNATLTELRDIAGKNIFEAFPDNPETPDANSVANLQESFTEVLRSGKTHVMKVQQYDILNTGQSGGGYETRFWSPKNVPVLNDEGKVEMIIHSVRDVTEEIITRNEIISKNDRLQRISNENKFIDAELKQSNVKMQLIADLLPANIAYVGNDKKYKFVNKNYYKFYRTTPTDILGRSIVDFVQEKINIDVSPYVKKALDGHSQLFENVVKDIDGNHVVFEVQYIPHVDDNDKVLGFILMALDITEEKSLEKEREIIAMEREELLKRKDDFISIAGHELKTPLTTIKGYINLINNYYDSLDQQTIIDYLHRTDVSIGKLNTLIHDLLDVSRIEAGKLVFNFDTIDLHELVVENIQNMVTVSDKHEIILKGNIHAKVKGDKFRLEQVLTNLLSNAIKYSPESKEIIVEIADQEKEVVISVTDHGIGIPQDQMDKVFKKFSRLTNSEFTSGLGLGLYICSDIIRRHKGKIWIESEAGKYTTFYFSLPKED